MNNKIIIGILIVIGALFLFNQGVSKKTASAGDISVTRNLPLSVKAGTTFDVVYTATNPDSEWFVSYADTISGGCSPTTLENVVSRIPTQSSSLSQTYTFTAPSSGSCTFTGTYYFADFPLTDIGAGVMTVCTDECTGQKECVGTGYKSCGSYDSDVCLDWSTPTACTGTTPQCSGGNCVECTLSSQCTGQTSCYTATCSSSNTCVYTNSCNAADTDKGGCVSRDELMVYGSKWLSHDITREVLMVAGSVWLHRDKTKC